MKIKILFFAFLFIAVSSYSQNNPFQKKFPLIDRYIDSLLTEWNIPGLALGIVYKDQLIYGKGYGYRDVENKLPVTTETIFPIGSNTKLFTATTAAMLQQEGKLSLDKPVKIYMPSLNFSNDELNSKTTLRDMLSHRTGLPGYDGISHNSPLTRKEAIARVVYMQPQLGFREGYIYNNMMFTAAGGVLENIAGKSWEDIIREKFFQPLDMKISCFTKDEMIKNNNYSFGYFKDTAKRFQRKQSFEQNGENLAPAGAIKSNVEDMSHWMIAQLNGGRYKGKQVIPEKAITETLMPNTITDKQG
ncbi:MAG: serine hydrolase domain-containing protein [Chitinophagaceae bacterium]